MPYTKCIIGFSKRKKYYKREYPWNIRISEQNLHLSKSHNAKYSFNHSIDWNRLSRLPPTTNFIKITVEGCTANAGKPRNLPRRIFI